MYRVMVAPNREQACWVCIKDNKAICAIPVFRDEECPMNGKTYPMQRMTGNELFPKENEETFFRTYLNKHRQIGIRAVMIFPDEELVRAACQARGRHVVSVQPVRVLDRATGKYLAAAWCVKCMDSDVDYSMCFVDLRDGIVLEGYDFENASYSEIGVGERFLAYDTYYEMKVNAVGEWYVVKSPMQASLGGAYAL